MPRNVSLDLSFGHFASLVGAIGVSTAVACGGSQPQPVQANEVAPAASTSAASAHASCSAAGCGASKAGSATGPTSPETTVAAGGTPPTDAPSAAPATSASSSPTPAKPVAKKKAGTVKTTPSGEASCGAGTCSGSTKKVF